MEITKFSKIGARPYQEDRYVVHQTGDGVLLAVMDGHGGQDAAQVCQDYLPSFWDVTVAQPGGSGEKRPFATALELVIWQLDSITNEYQSGSTISAAFIPTGGDKVYAAILGDSPIIVRSPDGVCHVSPSHNARNNPEERRAAIERGGEYNGGYVWNRPGDYGMGLQMTRSLGDAYMGQIIYRKPEIVTYELGDFVLLATDGVLDPAHANEHQAAANIVALIDHGCDAKGIVNYAVNLPTGDNATAILFKP